jgi:hypothetical protein
MSHRTGEHRQLGARLRERRQDELRKRPEIVRLAEIEILDGPQGKNLKHEPASNSNTSPQRQAAQPRASTTRKRRHSEGVVLRKAVAADLIDRWIPDVSGLNRVQGDGEGKDGTATPRGSSFVILHGLPNPSTPAMIRRFFSGLECKRILVLLRYPNILGLLDSNHDLPVRKDPRVDRYHPSQVRVLVQFENAPTALLACERSKEIMPLAESTIHPKTGSFESGTARAGDVTEGADAGDQVKGAAVAATPVFDKCAVRTIIDYVAVDANSPAHRKVPLHTLESRIREDLDPLVSRILWTAAFQALDNLYSPRSGTKYGSLASKDWRPYSRLIEGPSLKLSRLPSVDEQLKELQRQRGKVQEDRDRLLFPPDKPLWVMLDPHVARGDPVTQLTCRAAECLECELERCDRNLVQWRVHRYLSADSPDNPSSTGSE